MWKFVKNALFGGLGVLLPILLLIIVLKEFVELLIGLATPIADLFIAMADAAGVGVSSFGQDGTQPLDLS